MSKQMTKRQAQRLLNVSRSLREAPVPKAFTMSGYVYHDFDAADFLGIDLQDFDITEAEEQKVKDFCGMPQCALGHYASRRDLQRVIRIGHSDLFLFGNNRMVGYTSPQILEHFRITEDQAEQLFGSGGCGKARTAIQAAAYIERFVRQHYGHISG